MKARLGGVKRVKMQEQMLSVNSFGERKIDPYEDNIIEWTTLFRRNWEIFAEFFLGISLKPYQRAALHEIGVSDTFFWRAGRASSKLTVCLA